MNSEPEMQIGVSGASGNVGRAIIEELKTCAHGATIVGISRSPETIPAPAQGRRGDYDQPEKLGDAYAGIDRLILIPGPELMPGVRGRQLVAAIDAAIAARVGHIFLLSASGTRDKAAPAIGADYWVAEQHLIKNAVGKWTIFRMNFFSETLAEEAQMAFGMGALAALGENRVAYVSRSDVAAAIAGALTSDGHAGAIYNLTGPTAVTGAERAALLSASAGKPLGFAVLEEQQLRGGMKGGGVPDFIIDAVVSMQESFVEGSYDIVTGDVEKLSGKPPRALADVLSSAF
jgi:NAD(P)H dehydrogenase (quinone)